MISAFGGTFTLRDGILRLPGLRFSVQGARVDLDGRYSLRDQGLNFAGALRLDAPVSQTVTGFKSILLKPIDPLFRRNGAGTHAPDPHLRHGESARASAWMRSGCSTRD